MSSKMISLFLFFLCNLVQATGHENPIDGPKLKSPYKMKIDPSDISFRVDGMYYVLEDGAAILLSTLEFENGTYVATSDRAIVEDIFGVWWCYNCRNWNTKFDSICAYCRKPK